MVAKNFRQYRASTTIKFELRQTKVEPTLESSVPQRLLMTIQNLPATSINECSRRVDEKYICEITAAEAVGINGS